MSLGQAHGKIRHYALKFQEETDHLFVADYYFEVLFYLRHWIKEPGLQMKSLELIGRAFALKMAGLQETPHKQEFMGKSNEVIDEFLALFPDTETRQ